MKQLSTNGGNRCTKVRKGIELGVANMRILLGMGVRTGAPLATIGRASRDRTVAPQHALEGEIGSQGLALKPFANG